MLLVLGLIRISTVTYLKLRSTPEAGDLMMRCLARPLEGLVMSFGHLILSTKIHLEKVHEIYSLLFCERADFLQGNPLQ